MSEPLCKDQVLLERYRVVDKVDSSTFSAVFRGRDERLWRSVCIKVFRNTAKGERAGRISYLHFVQEAYALSQLSHPNTLRIFDFGTLTAEFGPFQGAPFQVTEFMEGGTLALLVQKDGPLTPAETLGMTVPLCGALAEAHQHGIVHLDIKPKNILFAAAGKQHPPKLADFGIAKILVSSEDGEQAQDSLAGEETLVMEGPPLVICTAVWASPEQLMGRPTDPTADVYSMGLLAAFMLTGGQLFTERKGNLGLVERQQSDRLIEELLLRHKIRDPIVRVLQKACCFESNQRFPTILDLSSALSEALAEPGRVSAMTKGSTDTSGSIARPASLELDRPPLATPSGAPAVELLLFPEPRRVGDRLLRCQPLSGESAEVIFPTDTGESARIRVSFLWTGEDPSYFHLKGLNCFIVSEGGRPSSALQFCADVDLDLVTMTRTPMVHLKVFFAKTANGAMIFTIGGQRVAVLGEAAHDSVLLDPGSGKECVLVYVPVDPMIQGEDTRQKVRKIRG